MLNHLLQVGIKAFQDYLHAFVTRIFNFDMLQRQPLSDQDFMSFGETEHEKVIVLYYVAGHRAFREQQLACVKGLLDLCRVVEIVRDIWTPRKHTLVIAFEQVFVLYVVQQNHSCLFK